MKVLYLWCLQALLSISLVSAQGNSNTGNGNQPPKVESIKRFSPLTSTNSASSVTFRIVFSEEVTGVTTTAFELKTVSGQVTGTLGPNAVTKTNSGNIYDVNVASLSGAGVFRLDLNQPKDIVNKEGKRLAGNFKRGETYTLIRTVPTISLASISSNNPAPSLAKTGDIVTLNFTSSKPINTPSVTIAGKTTTVSSTGTNSYKASYTMQATDASGLVPFNINFTSTAGVAGTPVTATTDGSKVTFDKTAPSVITTNRQLPLTEAISGLPSVTFRTTFNEKVTGVNQTDFALIVTSGSVGGTLAANAVAPVGGAGTTYDITVSSLTGSGSFRLDLKNAGTGIADAAGNVITTGFTGGQGYKLTQPIPTLSSVSIASNNPTPSLAKPGSMVTVGFTSSIAVNTPTVTIAGHAATVTHGIGNSYTAAYNMLNTDASGLVPFNINFTSTAGAAGTPVSATTDGSKVTFDKTAPTVTSTNRQLPLTEAISGLPSVTFRTTFNEKVTGVNQTDFAIIVTSGSVGATLAANAVAPVDGAGTTYDITLSSLTGSGSFRLDLKNAGTGIADAAGNAITTGFTGGQGYTLTQPPPKPGFKTIIPLNPVTQLTRETKDKPQAKTWTYDGKWWCVLSVEGGTKLFRLDGKSWTAMLTINDGKSKPDCWVAGDLVHLLIYKGSFNNTVLYTLQYDVAAASYKLWPQRTTGTVLIFPEGSQSATLVMDGNGRIWTATDGLSDIKVWYSDAPYISWNGPITLSNNVTDDDMCTLVAMPSLGKIGLFWSNQKTKRFGFKTHADGTDPATWSADEIPAEPFAIDTIGGGIADNHMSAKVGSDGTVYIASKTSYDSSGLPKLVLLVRRPAGAWDPPYPVTMFPHGTQPCLLLNEMKGKLKVVYTSVESGGDILYSESSTSNISFGTAMPLIHSPGVLYNYSTSTHQNYTSSVVIFATDVTAIPNQAVSVLASDDDLVLDYNPHPAPPSVVTDMEQTRIIGSYPNPSSGNAIIRFTLATRSAYTLTLYDDRGIKIKDIKTGRADAGVSTTAELDGRSLLDGYYLVRLQAGTTTRVLRILISK